MWLFTYYIKHSRGHVSFLFPRTNTAQLQTIHLPDCVTFATYLIVYRTRSSPTFNRSLVLLRAEATYFDERYSTGQASIISIKYRQWVNVRANERFSHVKIQSLCHLRSWRYTARSRIDENVDSTVFDETQCALSERFREVLLYVFAMLTSRTPRLTSGESKHVRSWSLVVKLCVESSYHQRYACARIRRVTTVTTILYLRRNYNITMESYNGSSSGPPRLFCCEYHVPCVFRMRSDYSDVSVST